MPHSEMRLINFKNTLVSRDYCTRFLRPGQLSEVHSQKILFPYSRSCKQIFGEFLPDRASPNFLHFRVHFSVFKVGRTRIYIGPILACLFPPSQETI